MQFMLMEYFISTLRKDLRGAIAQTIGEMMNNFVEIMEEAPIALERLKGKRKNPRKKNKQYGNNTKLHEELDICEDILLSKVEAREINQEDGDNRKKSGTITKTKGKRKEKQGFML